MSIDFTNELKDMDAREAAVRDWLAKAEAERLAHRAAEEAHRVAKAAFAAARDAILAESEFAGYGFTSTATGSTLTFGRGLDASDIAEAVRAMADAPPEAPDASDSPEMGNDEAEACEAMLFDREGVE